jgi:hypothetical protein
LSGRNGSDRDGSASGSIDIAAAVWLVSNTRPVAPPSSLTVICGLNITDELAELGAFTDTEAGGKAAGVEAS